MHKSLLPLILAMLPGVAGADPSSSANYAIVAGTMDSMGSAVTSANYSQIGSSTGLSGVSTSSSDKLRSGFAGQIYDPAGIEVVPAANTMAEAGTIQLAVWRLMDDDTHSGLVSNPISWSVESGPVANVNSTGLATAKLVYADTIAVIKAKVGSDSDTVSITVVDTILDNFGTYAGDGLGDHWQVTYFGENNAAAAPANDGDGDGQSNLAEFRAGYSPVDIGSYLKTDNLGVAGGNFRLRLSRVQPGTKYVFERSTDLRSWTEVASFQPSFVEAPYVKLLPTSGDSSFYRVRLETP